MNVNLPTLPTFHAWWKCNIIDRSCTSPTIYAFEMQMDPIKMEAWPFSTLASEMEMNPTIMKALPFSSMFITRPDLSLNSSIAQQENASTWVLPFWLVYMIWTDWIHVLVEFGGQEIESRRMTLPYDPWCQSTMHVLKDYMLTRDVQSCWKLNWHQTCTMIELCHLYKMHHVFFKPLRIALYLRRLYLSSNDQSSSYQIDLSAEKMTDTFEVMQKSQLIIDNLSPNSIGSKDSCKRFAADDLIASRHHHHPSIHSIHKKVFGSALSTLSHSSFVILPHVSQRCLTWIELRDMMRINTSLQNNTSDSKIDLRCLFYDYQGYSCIILHRMINFKVNEMIIDWRECMPMITMQNNMCDMPLWYWNMLISLIF